MAGLKAARFVPFSLGGGVVRRNGPTLRGGPQSSENGIDVPEAVVSLLPAREDRPELAEVAAEESREYE